MIGFARFIVFALCACAATLALASDPAPQQFARLGDIRLESGAVIRNCAIGYRTLGKLNADASNAVLVTTWHTGTSAEVIGLAGPDKLFDPSPWFVIVVDAIGNGVSCSPSNSAAQHGPAFPAFTIRDMVESQYRVLTEKLGLRHLHAVLGYSMGGMQTYQWAVSHPGFMDVAIPIAGTPRMSSYDLLFLRTAERAMVTDPAYARGHYRKNPALPTFQLLFAMNFTSPAYRVAQTPPGSFEQFYKESVAYDPGSADANNSLWQIRAMQKQDVAPGSTLQEAAGKVKARMHIIHARQDHLVNAATPLAFAELVHAQTTVLETDCGHSAIQCELPAIRAAVERALADTR